MKTNEQVLSRMKVDLTLRGFSPHSQKVYLNKVDIFLNYCNKNAEEMDEQDIRDYMYYLINVRKLAPNTVNVYHAAICFLFAVTLNRNLNYRQVPRMKVPLNLPDILSKEEISLLFENELSLRNKTILMTTYSAGLRISEICKLKVSDIDVKSMRIFIKSGKGRKDRYAILSQKNIEILREYWQKYHTLIQKTPDGYLFVGQNRKDHLTNKSIHRFFKIAIERAGINKKVSMHTLRACFATHLLESGMDIFSIKELLGHSCISSTMVYLRLMEFGDKIKSPLDLFDM